MHPGCARIVLVEVCSAVRNPFQFMIIGKDCHERIYHLDMDLCNFFNQCCCSLKFCAITPWSPEVHLDDSAQHSPNGTPNIEEIAHQAETRNHSGRRD